MVQAGSVCAIGSGMSMGQVGPSVQLGAMSAKGFSTLSKGLKKYEKLLMTAGSGAGFAAILNAPLAGLAFSMEEMNRRFSAEMLATSLTACISSDFITSHVFGLSPLFEISTAGSLPLGSWWLLIVTGIVTGAFGAAYNTCISALQACYKRIKFTWIRIAIPMAASDVLIIVYPYALGGGNTLIYDLTNADWTVQALAILLIVKYSFTVICFSSGSPGGLIGPVLVIGGITGCLLAGVCGFGDCMDTFLLLGMAGYFTATIRAPFTAVLLLSEMTGSLSFVPVLSLVCLIAYLTADRLKSKPIFRQLLDNILKK